MAFSVARRRVAPIQQLHMADCGPACLAMVLRYYGRHESLDEVRDRFGGGRDGSTAYDILEASRAFGMEGRAVRLELEDVPLLPAGAILHWRMSHFVVLERATRGGAEIVDPDGGSRFAGPEELSRSFTGVAVLLEPTASFETKSKGASPLWAHARRIAAGSGLLGRTFVTSALLQIFAMALPLATGIVVDRIIPARDVPALGVFAGAIVAVALYAFLASYVRAHLLLALRTQLDFQMTAGFLRHLLRLPFAFFQLRHTGDLLLRLDSNAVIRQSLTSAALSGLLDGILVTGYLAVILFTDWRLGLLVVALGVVRVAIFFATRRRARELTSEALQAQSEAATYQVQMVEGIETLKTSGAERRAAEIWTNLFVNVLNVSIRRGRLSALVDSLLFSLELISPLAVLAYGASLVLEGRLSLGTMLAQAALAAGFLRPLGALVATALDLQQLGSTVERVDEVLEKAPEQPAGRPPAPALQGGVTLAALSFRYASNAPWAVQDVDLEVPARSQVAIVGPSGSGKSTLARLIAGLYEPEAGSVLFDGRDLRAFDVVSLRRQIGFVPQHPFLFGATIRSNITMANVNADMADVERAAERADLSADIAAMPLRFETPLATNGSNLSGGQRQRIAIARSLLGQPPILVLDEATSHLDTRSERKVYESLAALACTRVVIAHRLSTVVDSDLIVVMDRGRIVERGTHEALIAQRGLYAELTNRGAARDPK